MNVKELEKEILEEMKKYRKMKTQGRDGNLIEVLARKADFGKGKDKQAVMLDDVITAQLNYEKGRDEENKRWLASQKKLEKMKETMKK